MTLLLPNIDENVKKYQNIMKHQFQIVKLDQSQKITFKTTYPKEIALFHPSL